MDFRLFSRKPRTEGRARGGSEKRRPKGRDSRARASTIGTGFYTELTGRENIYLNGAIIDMKRAEISNTLISSPKPLIFPS
jgi:ABC-type Na+ transport system ATPase subunit NatA